MASVIFYILTQYYYINIEKLDFKQKVCFEECWPVSCQLGMFGSFSCKLQRNVKSENVTCCSITPLYISLSTKRDTQLCDGVWGGQTTKQKTPATHQRKQTTNKGILKKNI